MKTGEGEIRIRLGVRYEPLTDLEAIQLFEGIVAALNEAKQQGHLCP